MDTTTHALNRQYIFQNEVYEPSEEPKEVPAQLAKRDKQLDADGGADEIASPLDTDEGLPTAIPAAARTKLEDAGVDTWQGLLDLIEDGDLEEVDGIGEGRAENVRRAAEQVEDFHSEDSDE